MQLDFTYDHDNGVGGIRPPRRYDGVAPITYHQNLREGEGEKRSNHQWQSLWQMMQIDVNDDGKPHQ